MKDADYVKLTAAKAAAAAQHDAGKRAVRARIANAIKEAPAFAIQFAAGALQNRNAPWQQWSRQAWGQILETKTPAQIAEMLENPVGGDQQCLADSHPFAGLVAAIR